ncbi:hypothetical protein [Zunongwangia sp. H14]|uniref:hypothetical protein n=1 Tax=Zunongwangia sp. H14 TaxID=3240792 RepID=UPI0035621BF4
MNKPITYLLGFLIFIGCGAFVYGIAQACLKSWPHHGNDYEIAAFLSNTVTSIAAVLSTNLGAVLGITVSNPTSKFRESKSWNPLSLFTSPSPSAIQTIACYVYILSLIAAAIVWAHRDFITETNKIVPLIPELTKSLLGVIVGVLAISLNTNSQNPKP